MKLDTFSVVSFTSPTPFNSSFCISVITIPLLRRRATTGFDCHSLYRVRSLAQTPCQSARFHSLRPIWITRSHKLALLFSHPKEKEDVAMSDGMALSGVPPREDCASCPEAGDRCALHQRMVERQQGLVGADQTQQAPAHDGGPDAPRVNEQSHLSKAAKREMNRLKTQEGQMINVRPTPLTLHV